MKLFQLTAFLFVFSALSSFGQIVHRNIKVHQIESKILNETRTIWIYTPPSDSIYHYQPKLPALYLIDGNSHLEYLAALNAQLSITSNEMILPPMVIVGILNTDRTRDLSPSHSQFGYILDPNFVKNSGGADKFIRFMGEELIPYIEKNTPSGTYRTLLGHSLGGLTVLETIKKYPKLFKNYICIDPSLWWEHQQLIPAYSESLKKNADSFNKFYLAIANTMSDKMTYEKVQNSKNLYDYHIQSILKFQKLLPKTPQFQSTYYPLENHNSLPSIASRDALKWIFNFYKIDTYGSNDAVSTFNPSIFLSNHFKKVSKEFGTEWLPLPTLVDFLSGMMLFVNPKQELKSQQLQKLNQENNFTKK